jgi:hypothetical protein
MGVRKAIKSPEAIEYYCETGGFAELGNKMPILRIEANKEIFVMVIVCFGDLMFEVVLYNTERSGLPAVLILKLYQMYL